MRALLLWLTACDSWEVRERVPVWPAWEEPGKVFGPFLAEEVPGVPPPPEAVLREAHAIHEGRRSQRHLDTVNLENLDA